MYLRTMSPTVLDGDSGEFQYMAYILGVPHSSGYPLYILIAKLFTFLPIGDVAYRVNLFSVVCAALAVPIVYMTALRLIRVRVPALLAAAILALAPFAWGGALETKPYAFHLLLGALALFFALRWHQDARPRDPSTEFILSKAEGLRTSFYALAFVCGLGLANHHVIVFTAPAFMLVVWLNRARVSRAMFARGVLLALAPLLLYAYIPIRAEYFIRQQDPANWQFYQREDAILKGTVTAYYIHTPLGVFNLITGLDNWFKLGPRDAAEQVDRFGNAGNLLVQQFTWAGIALAVLGAVMSFRRDRKLFAILLLYAAGVAFIALFVRAKSTVYYFSLMYFILALWIGFAIDALLRWARHLHRALPYAVAGVITLLPIYLLIANYARLDESSNYAPRDFAQAVLRDDIAPNAIVIAPWEISQPIRYFQFVENQRPDLLVVMLAPEEWSAKFETMLASAKRLNRPIYVVEFFPKIEGAPHRSVQVVQLPLTTAPSPRYQLSEARVVPDAQVIGYGLDPDPPQPGKPMRVLVYYRALARMYPMYSTMLSVSDATGKLIGEYEGFPGSVAFPTYRWQTGEVYRSSRTIDLPKDAPVGLYNLDLYWYVYDLDTRQPDYKQEFHLPLGAIRVGDFGAAQIEHAQPARVGDAIAFLGWNGASSVARGQTLPLDLIWRADRALNESYTVFVHLVDAAGRVVTDADSPPFSGLFPTTRWQIGEVLRDRHILKIPNDLAPGNYAVEVGMYLPTTGARLPIDGAADKIMLTQVSVR
ncbi:MAG: DUF2723 domain-containing protein [Chloroflexota bacterium]